MANQTDPLASLVHGTNPQNLIENVVKQRIYEQMYWKEECFALTPESLLEKAVEIRCVGGTHGGQRKATKFLCLVLKLLQLQPDKEIIYEFISNEDFKYVRVLGAFYLRLVGSPKEIYEYLEPLYHDFRKIRKLCVDGTYSVVHIDEAVQEMLTETFMYDTSLPRLPYRHTLVSVGRLKPRASALQDEFEVVRKKLEEKKAKMEEEQRRKREENLELEKMEAAERAAQVYRNGGVPSGKAGRHEDRGRRDDLGENKRSRSGRGNTSPEGRGTHEREAKSRRTGGSTSERTKEGDGGGQSKEDLAIQEANALRAKLGLKPLRM